MSRIYDITRNITPQTAVWPGDTSFSFDVALSRAEGEVVNVTTLHMSAHTGTHADAPWHYIDSGKHPNQLPLERYVGPAHVVTLVRISGGIVPEDFDGVDLEGVQRLLIHTWVSDLPDSDWPVDFPYPTVELIEWLAHKGVVLLGVDMPSVDEFNSPDLPVHHALHQHNIVNLELVCLRGVPDGVYELVALPLKIADVCGSPVRAILRA